MLSASSSTFLVEPFLICHNMNLGSQNLNSIYPI